VFFAAYQSVQDTAHRLRKGECWVALAGDELVGWYRRRGYVPVGAWRWDVTSYESVVLRKVLGAAG
jgi:hypothetical protein